MGTTEGFLFCFVAMETGEAYEFHMRMAWGYRTQEIKPRCQGDLRMDISGNSAGRILDFSRLWQHGWGAFIFSKGLERV